MWKVEVKVTQSFPTLRTDGLHSPWNSPGQNTGVGNLNLLQGILPTQGSDPGLLHCRRILYQLRHKGSRGQNSSKKPVRLWKVSVKVLWLMVWKKKKGPNQVPIRFNKDRVLLLLSHFSCVWLCDPTDSSPPGSSIPGILQARTLEWAAISFSKDRVLRGKNHYM